MANNKRFLASSIWLGFAILSVALPRPLTGHAQTVAATPSQSNAVDYLASLNDLAAELEVSGAATTPAAMAKNEANSEAVAAKADAERGTVDGLSAGDAMSDEYLAALTTCMMTAPAS